MIRHDISKPTDPEADPVTDEPSVSERELAPEPAEAPAPVALDSEMPEPKENCSSFLQRGQDCCVSFVFSPVQWIDVVSIRAPLAVS